MDRGPIGANGVDDLELDLGFYLLGRKRVDPADRFREVGGGFGPVLSEHNLIEQLVRLTWVAHSFGHR